ncbi:MAG: PEP-CTERM sorting domain-containing protein [Planctomycetota bacterium]|nr:MAG: PEP-CTERM sorting domain-containing protein [Planctomycetota bacterium]
MVSSGFHRFPWMRVAAAAAVLATAASAFAQDIRYWDIDGPTPGAGGPTPSGTWSSAAANWSPNAAGDAATEAWISGTAAGNGRVAFFSAGSDATGSFTVTIDGTNFASGMVVNQGTVNLGGAGVVGIGSGTVTVRPGTTLGINNQSRVTQSAGGLLVLDGGTLLMSNTGNAGSLWTALGAGIQLSPNSGTVNYNVGNNVTIFQGVFLGEGGTTVTGAQTLTKTGTSELRVQGANTANYTFEKLKVLGGLYRIGSSTNATGQLSKETGFGALPFGETADAITLDGGAIGVSFAMTTDPFRGITLGAAGGVLNTTSTTLGIAGPISGTGALRVIGRGVTLSGGNSYSGGTIIGSDIAMVGGITTTTSGTLTIDSDLRLGAEPGVVSPTNVRLGTDTAAGVLNVTASTLFPATRGFTIGAAGGTLSTSSGATVTLAGPLSGTGGFIKTSSGTLVLSASNTISGGITSWGGGMLEVSSDANLGAVSGTLQPAALTLAGATTSGRVRATETFTMPANRGITVNVGGTTATPLGGTIDVVTDKTLTVAGPITGPGRLTKSGSGTLVLSGSSSYAGTTTVSSGTLVVSGMVTGTAAVSVIAGATIVLASGNALATRPLTVSSFGTATLSPYLQTTVGGLNPNAGGLVDVGNGMVTVTSGLTVENMLTAITAGYNGGTWTGTSGITSSTAAVDSAAGSPRAVGWLDNGDGSLTVAYAAPGDTNLDWSVDILDTANFLALDKFDTGSPATWREGDFNYDGIVDIFDAAAFVSTGLFNAGNYNTPSGSRVAVAPVGSVAAVPEPSTWALLAAACGGAVAACRGRRRG